jgi:hypothetical protein
MTTLMNNKIMCCMTPLSIGFEVVVKEKFHKLLKVQCEQLHEQITKDRRYCYRFFSGSRFMYAVKFHHDEHMMFIECEEQLIRR